MTTYTSSSVISRFFFRDIDARGFGLMRIGWAVTALVTLLPLATTIDTTFGYPERWEQLVYAHPYQFSPLSVLERTDIILALYYLLILSTVGMAIGLYPRLSTIISVVLFALFVERNVAPFHNENAVLRTSGFLLLIAPSISAFSLTPRIYTGNRESGKNSTMPIWTYRLLLWQVVIIYVYSGWHKLLSPYWLDGSAVVGYLKTVSWSIIQIHIEVFTPLSRILSFGTILWELSWIVLLIPHRVGFLFKRFLILSGTLLHILWALLFIDVLPLSLSMITMYLGLLQQKDFNALRRYLPARLSNTVRLL